MDRHDFLLLLQDINLEKFGLHNFIEHLDLAKFELPDESIVQTLKELRDISQRDYERVKEIVSMLNEAFNQDLEPGKSEPTTASKRRFTVGNMVNRSSTL
jgi:hypothetical protein